MRAHSACAGWAILGALNALTASAWAQDQVQQFAGTTGDPGTDLFIRLASLVGLPGVVAWTAWQLRGLVQAGIVVRLSDEDRKLLQREPPAGRE